MRRIKTNTLLYRCFVLISVACITFACSGDGDRPVQPQAYYPMEIGHYQIFQVEERTYSASETKPKITTWQERDQVEEVIATDNSSTTYIVVRSTRATSTDFWTKQKDFTVRVYPDRVVTNVDNQNIVSMIFPIDARTTWNGNQYNNADEKQYYYENVNTPTSVNDLSFTNTLTVVERNDTTIIDRYSGHKTYALNVGLIADTQISYQYCQSEDCIGSGKIDSGRYFSRTIIESSNL